MNWSALSVDAGSAVPIYRQICEQLAGWIRSGRLVDGARLPPTRELAGLLGLNRTTVAAAYEALENDGMLKAHVGRGSYVSAAAGSGPMEWEQRFRTSAPDRELYQVMQPGDGELVDFRSARLEPTSSAVEALQHAAQRELSEHGRAILALGAAEGYPPLRDSLISRMRAAGVARDGDEVLVTSGCQQGLDLVAKILVRPGERVLIEDPVYPGARDLFLAAGAEVSGARVGPEGISVPEVEQQLTRQRPRLLVVTPSFQNPTGATMPLEARRELLRVAARFDVPVVENDVYAGLRYRGQETPSLKSLDRDGRVIYLRSFSKVAHPGLRVGWCVAPRAVARRLAAAKQLTDLHTDQLSQAVLYRMWTDGTLDQHLHEALGRGRARLEAAVEACRREMPPGVEWLIPEGGMHLWLRLPAPLDASELLVRARAERVLFIPGRFFAVTRPQNDALRLSFAGLEPEKIRRGVAGLARLVREQAPAASALSERGVPALV